MKLQMPIKIKCDILSVMVIITVGFLLNLYATKAIFEQAASLRECFEFESRLILMSLIYDLLCMVLIVRYGVCSFLYFMSKRIKPMFIYIMLLIFSILSLLYLPFQKLMYLYKFNGFVAGIKTNVDEQEFRNWINSAKSNIPDNGGIIIEKNELAHLSKTGVMECDGIINKYDSEYYEVKLIWGSALSGHYGLLITNDSETLLYIKNNRDVVEVYDGVWAWTENK